IGACAWPDPPCPAVPDRGQSSDRSTCLYWGTRARVAISFSSLLGVRADHRPDGGSRRASEGRGSADQERLEMSETSTDLLDPNCFIGHYDVLSLQGKFNTKPQPLAKILRPWLTGRRSARSGPETTPRDSLG